MNCSSYDIHKTWHITIPTVFTLLRIALTPFIVYAMVHQRWALAFYLFLGASLTDIIDGSLARWWNARSFLGACLDVLADKLLLLSCFTTLACIQISYLHIPQWFVLFILCKELTLIVGSLILYMLKGSLEIKPTKLGKITTFVQICFIIWFFFCYFFKWLPLKTYSIMLCLLITLMIVSLLQYISIGIHYFFAKNNAKGKNE